MGVRRKAKRSVERKLGMVLSGGGARGAFQVGVYETLIKDPRFVDGPRVLSGTSAGAINSALIAAGKTPDEMMDFWNSIADDPPVIASEKFFASATRTLLRLAGREIFGTLMPGKRWSSFMQRAWNHFPPRPGALAATLVEYLLTSRFELVSHLLEGIEEPFLADTTKLRQRLVDTFGGEKVSNLGHVHLSINTVDAQSGRVVRFVTTRTPYTQHSEYVIVDGITVDMVLASASIPLLFPTVKVGEFPYQLWDGGLLVNTPLAPVVAMGADEIVTVLVTEPVGAGTAQFPHFGRAVERTIDSFLENAYNVDRKLLLERNRLVGMKGTHYRAVKLYEAIRPGSGGMFNAGSYLYFDREIMAAMRETGRRAATEWLAEGPRIDRIEEDAAGAAA